MKKVHIHNRIRHNNNENLSNIFLEAMNLFQKNTLLRCLVDIPISPLSFDLNVLLLHITTHTPYCNNFITNAISLEKVLELRF